MITKIGQTLASKDNDISEDDFILKANRISSKLSIPVIGAAATAVSSLPLAPIVLPIIKKDRGSLTDAESNKLMKDMWGDDITIYNEDDKINKKDIPNLLRAKNKKLIDSKNLLRNFYSNTGNLVYAPKNSYALAHELGHATGLAGQQNWLGKAYNLFTHGPKNSASLFSGGTEAAKAARAAYNKEMGIDEPDNKTLNIATNIGRLSTVANLGEEAQATIRGLHALHKIQGGRGVWNAAKVLLPAYSTYVATALGSHVAAPLLGNFYGKQLAKNEKAYKKFLKDKARKKQEE